MSCTTHARPETPSETNRVMEGLLNYTITHFEFEEGLQEKAGYPFLKAHQRIHEIFMKKVADIRARAAAGEEVAHELLSLLKGWLVSHIKSEDRDYVESVRKFLESDDQADTGWLNALLKKFATNIRRVYLCRADRQLPADWISRYRFNWDMFTTFAFPNLD